MYSPHNLFQRTTFFRENRPQTPVNNAAGHRRKSRSPEPRALQDVPSRVEQSNYRKKRKQNNVVASTSSAAVPGGNGVLHNQVARPSRLSMQDDTTSDRGRKPKRRPQSSAAEDPDARMTQDAPHLTCRRGKSKKKERSQSRDIVHRLSGKTATPEPSDVGEDDEKHYTGPLAAADYARIKEELKDLKKRMTTARKTINNQSRVIDGLRQELSSTQKARDEHRVNADKLKTHAKKAEDVISSIEANLNCHICMEMLMKPYGLSPCGHVLCLKCLQDWFRAAPPAEDEMYDDDTPQELIRRKKSCPVCRTSVKTRPIPLFVIKDLVSAVERSKGSAARPSPPPDSDVDPWAGIFGDSDESDEEDVWSAEDDGIDYVDDDYGEGDEDGDDGYAHHNEDEDGWPFEGYGTDEEEVHYDGEYLGARWAPPTVFVSPEDYIFDDLTDEQLSLLRRGATLQMVALFSMTYTHDDGIRAAVDGNQLYLGWNIDLNPDDQTGEEYMDWVMADVFERPERWERQETDSGFIAWRLIREDDDEEYETTDTEAWAADLGLDDEEF